MFRTLLNLIISNINGNLLNYLDLSVHTDIFEENIIRIEVPFQSYVLLVSLISAAQSAGAVEYTGCSSAKR